MKPLLLLITFAISVASKPVIDFEILANAIKIHENSKHYPYGVEHRNHGQLVGYPEAIARRICIAMCQKEFEAWNGHGDFFKALNKVYAQDYRWYLGVEKLYYRQTKNKTK